MKYIEPIRCENLSDKCYECKYYWICRIRYVKHYKPNISKIRAKHEVYYYRNNRLRIQHSF